MYVCIRLASRLFSEKKIFFSENRRLASLRVYRTKESHCIFIGPSLLSYTHMYMYVLRLLEFAKQFPVDDYAQL